mmetsp:Transcript_29261/g.41422  ORF Transcript_29261/g.41422 Transcript_29261/m.41422 type:complete len:282 (+) Transcript_29261:115-960(+)
MVRKKKDRLKHRSLFQLAFIIGLFCFLRSSDLLFSSPSIIERTPQRNENVFVPPVKGKYIDQRETTNKIRKLVGQWPNPLIVVGLPKAGTNSIAEYFRCGGIQNVAHNKCLNHDFCGSTIQQNILAGQNPLLNTGNADVYVQIDVELDVTKGLPCYFPQIEALDSIHRAHPNSTFLLNTREVNGWIRSVRKWAQMDARLSRCNITGLPSGKGLKERELKRFFSNQQLRIKRFVDRHTSHRLVQVQIDSANAGELMEEAFGIDKQCWGHHNKNHKLMPPVGN